LTVFVVLVTQSASKAPQDTAPQSGSVAAARQIPVVWQVSHTPLHAELQQTPSTQLLLAHSVPLTHAAPLPFLGSEQLPASSHKLMALHACPALRALPWHSRAASPQRPAMQRSELTSAGNSRHVVSAGHWMSPQASSSGRLVQAVPEAPHRRQAPSHAAVQHTLPPPSAA
jgi:hypothetical protein